MCNPAVAVAAFMVANETLAIDKEKQIAKNAADSAIEAVQVQYKILAQKENQINDDANLKVFERKRQALRQYATMKTVAGESGGLGGVSPVRNMMNSWMQSGYDIGILETNRENQLEQVQYEKQAAYSSAQSRVNQAFSNLGDGFTNFMRLGKAGVGGYFAGAQLFGTESFLAGGAAETATAGAEASGSFGSIYDPIYTENGVN